MNKIKKIMSLFGIIIKSFLSKKKIFLLGIPTHGNLGDHAIAMGEKRFLNDYFHEYKIIMVESILVVKFNRIFKWLIKDNLILYSGGGFLGSLWPNEEDMFEFIIENFSNNKVIVLPQTLFFSNDVEGKKIYERAKKAYYINKNLIFFVREKYSYEYMKNKFPGCKIYLAPDMVLYLDKTDSSKEKNDALFCIRSDKEKVNYNLDSTRDYIANNIGEIHYTDTVLKRSIFGKKSIKYVEQKITEFSNYKIVITDRLHGMIFSFISGTPCLVLENKSYKILGVYEWIKDCGYIKLVNESTIMQSLDEVINHNTNYSFDKSKYDIIRKVIEKVI